MPITVEALELSGSVGLDFVNTIVPARAGPVDLLDNPDAFEWWMGHAMPPCLRGLVPLDHPGRRMLTVEARWLRTALVQRLRAIAADGRDAHGPEQGEACIDRALRAGTVTHYLHGAHPVSHYPAGGPLRVLTPVALSALAVARGARPERLRECDAEDCARWFIDTSKGGRRRWCSMQGCGNRAKAARHRRRQAGGK